MITALLLLLATPLLSGCIGRLHTPYNPGESIPISEAPLPEDSVFAYQRRPLEPRQKRLANVRRNYDKILLEFPAVDGRGNPPVSLAAHYYRSKRPSAG